MAEVKSEKNVEREFVIPLRSKYKHAARYKKTPKAIKSIKEYIARHMKIYDKDLNKIKLDKAVNEFMWARGIKNPPFSVKVKANKDSEGIVKVDLVDLPNKLKFKKLREEKVSKEAKEAIESKKGFKERMQEQVKGTFNKGEEAQGQEEKSEEAKTEDKAEKVDEDKDGVEDKKEVEEKKEAVKESTQKMEKDMAKKEKHTTKSKTPKQEKNDRKEYNKSSHNK
jgi:large subunit ribosomal protein L31e